MVPSELRRARRVLLGRAPDLEDLRQWGWVHAPRDCWGLNGADLLRGQRSPERLLLLLGEYNADEGSSEEQQHAQVGQADAQRALPTGNLEVLPDDVSRSWRSMYNERMLVLEPKWRCLACPVAAASCDDREVPPLGDLVVIQAPSPALLIVEHNEGADDTTVDAAGVLEVELVQAALNGCQALPSSRKPCFPWPRPNIAQLQRPTRT